MQRVREGVPGQWSAEAAPLHARSGGKVRVRHLREEAQVKAVAGRPSERPSGKETIRVSISFMNHDRWQSK